MRYALFYIIIYKIDKFYIKMDYNQIWAIINYILTSLLFFVITKEITKNNHNNY